MHQGERHLLEILVGIDGIDVLHQENAHALRCRNQGDKTGEERHLRRAKIISDIISDNKIEKKRKKNTSFENVHLYGGISGLDVGNFELLEGLSFEPVFAHVMAPYIVAFSRPETGKPHPGPWKAASGGIGFDIKAQISLAENLRPTGFDRINTLWWILSLLRIHHPVGVRMPLISDTNFSAVQEAIDEPMFFPIEISPKINIFEDHRIEKCSLKSLEWIKDNFVKGAAMMREERFSLSYRAIDQSSHVLSASASTLLIWSALECLFNVGRGQITHKICLAISTYIEEVPRDRDRLYKNIKRLYNIRCEITHAAQNPNDTDVFLSFDLARKCILKSIERSELPNFDILLEKWKNRN